MIAQSRFDSWFMFFIMLQAVVEKKCNDCKELKPHSEFQNCKQSRDGKDYYCKPCKGRRMKRYIKTLMADPKRAAKLRKSQTQWTRDNPGLAKKYGHAAWLRLRNEMLDHYGRKCACCGEKHVEFLTLEHVNRDGSAHRKEVGGGANTYRDLKRKGWPKKGFKVLCMNCNWAVRRGGVCPHKRR